MTRLATVTRLPVPARPDHPDFGGHDGPTAGGEAPMAERLDGDRATASASASASATTALQDALARVDDGLVLLGQVGEVLGPALGSLGEASKALGDISTARRFLDHAIAVGRAGGHGATFAPALAARAALAADDQDDNRAAALYREALVLFEEMGDLPALSRSLEGLGGVAARGGDPGRAMRIWGAAQTIARRCDLAWPSGHPSAHCDDLALVRQLLFQDEMDAARAEGASLSVDKAVAYAIDGQGRRRS